MRTESNRARTLRTRACLARQAQVVARLAPGGRQAPAARAAGLVLGGAVERDALLSRLGVLAGLVRGVER